MQRNMAALADNTHDLVIVGGGIFGICAAWDAALRGLNVALVERGDFAEATSANSFKIVHGGLRYLQHADLQRIRESSHERNILLRIAPHLVHPLPIVVPAYGHGKQGKEMLRAGLLAYDLLTLDRNRGIGDARQRIPNGRLLSLHETLELFPDLERRNLTGSALFYDGQIYNPPRLAMAYLTSAVKVGVTAANYAEMTEFLRKGSRVVGVKARDGLTGEILEIPARVVLNASGPWAEHLLRLRMGLELSPKGVYSRDACFVTPRRLPGPCALAVQGKTRDPDALLSRGERHLFLVPWRHYTLAGVWHAVHDGLPGDFTVTQRDLERFIEEINVAYPPFRLGLKDVSMWNAGLVPFGDNVPGASDLSYGKRSRIIDHSQIHGIEGLITMIGVRLTTSRRVAAKAVDLAVRKLARNAPKSSTAVTPIHGGRIDCLDSFVNEGVAHRPAGVHVDTIRALLYNHGSEYKQILRYLESEPGLAELIPSSTVLKAEVVHAVREEMAQKLADVVFRRTDLATGGNPGEAALRTCADLVGGELGWNEHRKAEELREVRACFPSF